MKSSQPDTVGLASRTNPGETLRNERESRGVALAAVARQLNLSERSVSQIEAGDFSQLPGHTFARGYVRSYASLLGLDPARLVTEFDQYTGTDATGSQVQSLGLIEEPLRLSVFGLRFLSFVLLLLLAGAAFYWWQERSVGMTDSLPAVLDHIEVDGADGTTQIHPLDEPEDQAVLEALQPEPLPATSGNEVAAAPLEGSAVQEVARSDMVQALPLQALPGSEAGESDAAEPPTAMPGATAEPAPATPEAGSGTTSEVATSAAPVAPIAPAAEEPSDLARVQLRYTADCWSRVTDADGRVLLNSLVREGTTHVLEGQPPISLHLGFARGVQITYNGDVVDLSPHIRGQTARLKLGQ